MSDGLQVVLILLSIPGCGVLLLLVSWVMGWRQLSNLSNPPALTPPVFKPVSVVIDGAAHYPRAAEVSISPAGITCAMSFPFRLWHRPFLLEWKQLVETYSRDSFFSSDFVLRFVTEVGAVEIKFPDRFEEKAKQMVDHYKAMAQSTIADD